MDGSIPAALGNLDSLTHLDLSINGLNYAIPVALGDLDNLTYLDLHQTTHCKARFQPRWASSTA